VYDPLVPLMVAVLPSSNVATFPLTVYDKKPEIPEQPLCVRVLISLNASFTYRPEKSKHALQISAALGCGFPANGFQLTLPPGPYQHPPGLVAHLLQSAPLAPCTSFVSSLKTLTFSVAAISQSLCVAILLDPDGQTLVYRTPSTYPWAMVGEGVGTFVCLFVGFCVGLCVDGLSVARGVGFVVGVGLFVGLCVDGLSVARGVGFVVGVGLFVGFCVDGWLVAGVGLFVGVVVVVVATLQIARQSGNVATYIGSVRPSELNLDMCPSTRLKHPEGKVASSLVDHSWPPGKFKADSATSHASSDVTMLVCGGHCASDE
jgi:hypothetical protein